MATDFVFWDQKFILLMDFMALETNNYSRGEVSEVYCETLSEPATWDAEIRNCSHL